MYPYFKFARAFFKSKRQAKIAPTEKIVLPMKVGLSDMDMFGELNNGRFLTLLDMARTDFIIRANFLTPIREEGWSVMVGASYVRYRRRLKVFTKYELHTELLGFDGRWYYFLQETIKNNTVHFSALMRVAVFSKDGLVPTDTVNKKLGVTDWPKELPNWVINWIEAEKTAPKL